MRKASAPLPDSSALVSDVTYELIGGGFSLTQLIASSGAPAFLSLSLRTCSYRFHLGEGMLFVSRMSLSRMLQEKDILHCRFYEEEQKKADENVSRLAEEHEGLREMLSSSRANIGIKMMGEIDVKEFKNACNLRFPPEEAEIKPKGHRFLLPMARET
ncbi:unnamed protein product [Fraxinus pennsylvanica]|uniref:Uncharacterized protein n=1 Tax=Fraxinus pennsylvanica TaxID=56036 RepID=A0AAD2E7C5_9LAMI|nr:unnamed protein product [Fraxinus pennsylvanica]